MQKRKVLIAIHQLNYGGVQKSLIPALNAIDYDKNDVTLYVRKDRLELLPYINSNVSRVIINRDRTRYYRKPYSVLLLFLMKLKLLFKQDTTSVNNRLKEYVLKQQMKYEKKHYFNNEYFDVAIAYIQRYSAQFVADYVKADKKIMFYHGSTDEEHERHERIMNSFDKIIGVSSGVVDVLKGLYPKYADKMYCLENYVDAGEVRKRSTEQQINISDEKIKLCSCGRMTNVKGFDMAVEAAKILKDKSIDFIWYIVGDGPERANIENKISLSGLQEYFVITGMKENPYPYIKSCDIYVQPSYEEAYGLTIREAIALYKPVVSTATVGGKTIIQNDYNGKICDINSDSLAESILALINDESLRKNIVKNISQIDYMDDLKRYKEKWAKILEV